MGQEIQTIPATKYILTEERAEALLAGSDEYYHDKMISRYLLNLMRATPMSSPVAYKICSGFAVSHPLIPDFEPGANSFPFKKAIKKGAAAYPNVGKPEKNSVDERDWNFLIEKLEKDLEGFDFSQEKSVNVQNLENLAEYLLLDEIDTETLIFFSIVNESHPFNAMSRYIVGDEATRLPAIVARFLGRTKEVAKVSAALDAKSVLMNCGLLEVSLDGDETVFFNELEEGIKVLVNMPDLDPSTFVEGVLGKSAVAELDIADFSALTEHIEMICTIIKNAVENGEEGINILLHGPAGSGKTELAAAIAKHVNLKMFAVGEDEEQSYGEGETSSRRRLNKLFQAHSFLKNTKEAILFFDELEDLLLKGTDSSKKSDAESKIVINRLMEKNPIVTMWAGNDPDKFHESFRQRFSYSLYVDYPPMVIRKKIWERQLALKDVALPEQEVTKLARQFTAPPRMIANSIRLAKLTEVNFENIEHFLNSSSKITYGDSEAVLSQTSLSEKFDPELINYDHAKENKVKSIINSGSSPRPYSMLLKGRPGTGINSFARYLAEGAIMNTAEYDMRSLVEPNPMAPPEAKIKFAFQSANDSKNLLVISNIDALSSGAKSQSASWTESGLAEVFMRCAYDHKLPMIISCYDPEIEIPGLVRDVFSLDLRIEPLTEEQKQKAFKVYFDREFDGKTLPQNLVPADFSKVAKVLKKGLNGAPQDAEIVDMLRSQVSSREARSTAGFHRRPE